MLASQPLRLAQLATKRAAERVHGKTFSGEPIAVRVWEHSSTEPIYFSSTLPTMLETKTGYVQTLPRLRELATRLSGFQCPANITIERLLTLTNEDHCFLSEHFCIIGSCSDVACCPQLALLHPGEPPVLRTLLQSARILLQPFPSSDSTGYLTAEQVVLDPAFLQQYTEAELQPPSVQLKVLLKANPAPTDKELHALADHCGFGDSADLRLHRLRLQFLGWARTQMAFAASRREDATRKELERQRCITRWSVAEIETELRRLEVPYPPRTARLPLLGLLIQHKLANSDGLSEAELTNLRTAQRNVEVSKIEEEAKRKTRDLYPAHRLTIPELKVQLATLKVPAGEMKKAKNKDGLVRLLERYSQE